MSANRLSSCISGWHEAAAQVVDPHIDVLSPGRYPWSAGFWQVFYGTKRVVSILQTGFCADMTMQLTRDVYFGDAGTEHSNCLVSQIFTKRCHVYNHPLLKFNLFFGYVDRQATPIHVFDCLDSPCIPCTRGNKVCMGQAKVNWI